MTDPCSLQISSLYIRKVAFKLDTIFLSYSQERQLKNAKSVKRYYLEMLIKFRTYPFPFSYGSKITEITWANNSI